jgi:hypothetical protein
MKKCLLLALTAVPLFLTVPLHAEKAAAEKDKVVAGASNVYKLDVPKGLTTRNVGIGIVDVLNKRRNAVLSQEIGKIEAKIDGSAKLDCSGRVTITFDNRHVVITDRSTDSKGHPVSAGPWIESLKKELLRQMKDVALMGSE